MVNLLIFSRVPTDEVFTPTTTAKRNFVERTSVNNRLRNALSTPGSQLIVYGESGSGKSSLLRKTLAEINPKYVTSRCNASTSFEELILDAFDQVGAYYVSTKQKGKTKGVQIGSDYRALKAVIAASSSTSTTSVRVVPPQLTEQRLGQFLGIAGYCWVIEDFHKPAESVKVRLAQTLKMFSDMSADFPRLRIILIGATDTAREIVQLDAEMARRSSEIQVQLMNDDEILQIIVQGEGLLNIDLSAIANSIVKYSKGIPSVCHQLCLNACQLKGLKKRRRSSVRFSDGDMNDILSKYIDESSDSLRAVFEKAIKRERERIYDNCVLLLTAIASGPIEGSSRSEIMNRVHKVEPSYPPSNATIYLQELTSDKRGSVLSKSPSGKYRFVDPLHHVYAQANLVGPNIKRENNAWSYNPQEIGMLLSRLVLRETGDSIDRG